MDSATHAPLTLTDEEMTLLAELLESAHTKLLIEIRHTHHRTFRDDLRHRLTLLESLRERCKPPMNAGSETMSPGA